MPESDKVSKFVAAITKEAEQRRAQIAKETEEFINSELKRAKEEAVEESNKFIQRESAKIRQDIGRELSRKKLEDRKRLFERREQITNEVFEKVKDRLLAFTLTEEYKNLLVASAKNAKSEINGNMTVLLKPEDIKYKQDILQALNGSAEELTDDDTIKIGGLVFKSADGSKLVDDTLDVRLKNQRAWFESNCGLIIE